MQQFFFFKIKRGQNKFDPEYYFVYRFSFARSLGHVHLLQSRSLMIMSYPQKWAFTYTFISTSTPLGNSNFIRASIVFEEEL